SSVFERFAVLQDEFERHTVRLGWLFVEVETIDRSVTVGRVDLLVRDPLSIQRHKLVHACDVQVLRKLLVDPSRMHLVHANKLCCSIIKIELLLNAENDISDNAILSDEHIKMFLGADVNKLSMQRALNRLTSLVMPSLSHVTFTIFFVS